jgi:hypothetical protein
MDPKTYVLLTRSNNGTYIDKVNVCADLNLCRQILQAMINANKNANRAEILEGNRDYIGDFRVKPLQKFSINMHRNLVLEVDDANNKS